MADNNQRVNWLLAIELAVVVLVSSAFLFYWNRVVGSIAAWALRLFYWRKYHAYITIGSLQISPLAGRIAFRDLEYHSSNISFRALNGHITWRYWKLRVRQEEDSESSNAKRNRLPTRIIVYAHGVEAFFFNRTPAYDAIIERMKKFEKEETESQKSSGTQDTANHAQKLRSRLKRVTKTTSNLPGKLYEHEEQKHRAEQEGSQNGVTPQHSRFNSTKPVKPPASEGVNWFREALPMELRIVTGSLVLGSDSTPTVLIGEFKRAEGVLQVTDSKSICDQFKVIMDLKLEEPKALMRTNVDYSGPILAHGKKVYDELLKQDPDIAKKPPSTLSMFLGFHLLAKRFPFLQDPKFSSPPVAGLPRDRVWRGLARYRVGEEERPQGLKREDREYAKVTTLLEAPALDLTYYADTAGLVPHPSEAEIIDETDEMGNVEPAPEYGIDINIHGGIIKYGPWADRQRDALQRTFAPAIFFDSEPKPRLKPGDTRLHTMLQINLQLSEETILRIPTREHSKDWQYDNSATDVERRYGWLDVTAGANSSIHYTQAQFATENGYDAMLVLHLDSLQIASSVNLETFVTSQSCKLSMTMPTPLRWDARRDWGLDVTLCNPEITLLRDHVTLISDLSKDWSSGAVGDFHHFVPNHYNFRVSLINYSLHLLINDFNIVDRPKSRNENAFVDLCGPRIDAYVAVAATQYRPEFSVIPFTVHAQNARVELCVPSWDTHRSFGSGDTLEVGNIGDLTASGSYLYYSTTSPEHQETLKLHLEGRRVIFKALGWVIRRMFAVKDNYFGGFTQFTTMQEFLERFDHNPDSVGDPVEEKYRPGRSDPYAVHVTMNVEESLILTSDEIYNADHGLAMPVPQLSMALKSIEHYMELSLDVTPTYIVVTDDLARTYATAKCPSLPAREAIFIEGIELKANRLFGPQPRATTYLCLWECVLPRISAFLTPTFASAIQASMAALLYNFDDNDNAPASIYVPRAHPDVTFFKLGIGSMDAMLSGTEAAVSVRLPSGLALDTSTLGSRCCSSSMGLLVPTIDVRLLRRSSVSGDWFSLGQARTGLSLDKFKAPKDWQERVAKQQKFIRQEDRVTRRISYMYGGKEDWSDGHHIDGVYLPRPRAMETDDDESSTSSTDEVASLSEPQIPSSPEASDEDIPSTPFLRPARTAKRARSFATAREIHQASSAAEESDTSSAGSSLDSFGRTRSRDEDKYGRVDMAEALAMRLKQLRTMRAQYREEADAAPQDPPPDAIPLKPQVATSRPYGNVLRLQIHPVYVELSQAAVEAGQTVLQDLAEISRSDERLVDTLLIRHVDSVDAASESGRPFNMDVQLPLVCLRVPGSTNDTGVLPTIVIDIAGVGLEVERVPLATDILRPQSSLTAKLGIRSVTLSLQSMGALATGGMPDDLPEVLQPSENGTTVLHLGAKDVVFVTERASAKQRVSARIGSLDISAVTAAVGAVSTSAKSWSHIIERCQNRAQRRPAFADLLYHVVQGVAASADTVTQPAFFYESAYGLHVDDQRNIRRDIGWLILARLRHWLRTNRSGTTSEPLNTSESGNFVLNLLLDKTEEAGGNRDLILQQQFLQEALGSLVDRKTTSADAELPSIASFVYFKSFSFKHYGRLLETPEVMCSTIRVMSGSLALQRSTTRKEGEPRPIVQLRILIAAQHVEVDLQNSIFPAAQSVLQGVGHQLETLPEAESSTHLKQDMSTVMLISAIFEHIRLAISAGGIKGRLDARDFHTNTVLQKTRKTVNRDTHTWARRSMNMTSAATELALLQPPGAGHELTSGMDEDRVIISAGVRGFKNRMDEQTSDKPGSPSSRKVILGVKAIEFNSRPQLRAFSEFVREWHERQYPHYKDFIEQLKAFLAVRPTKVPTVHSARVPLSNLDLAVDAVQLHVRAAKGLWVRWELGTVFLTMRGTGERTRFGVRVAPQVVGAYPTSRKTKTKDGTSLRLPSITALAETQCSKGKTQLSVSVEVGFFLGILKPVVLDRLLSLHQKLGSDMLEVIRDYRVGVKKVLDTRHSRVISMASGKSSNSTPSSSNILLNLRLSAAGIRFGLKADDVATMLLFEAFSLRGNVTNQRTNGAAMLWRAKAEHVGLSLGHLDTATLNEDAEPIRRHRSAYMVLDVDMQEVPGHSGLASRLNVYLTRVHTVMHVAAVSELADLVRSWQADIHVLRENRANEVAEVRLQTRKVLRKLEAAEQSETSWFASRLLAVQITGIGLAIPLNDTSSIEPQQEGGSSVPALLFSIRVVDFQNRRNETARFKVQQIALQFLHKFDQMSSEHFAGDFHPSRNRMILPSLDSEAQMSSTADTWSLSAHCSASDFKLCLAPDVADALFQLVDLYEQGKARISQLERQYRVDLAKRDPSESVSAKYEDSASPIQPRKSQRIMVRMSYTFNSGIVELYRSSDDPGQRTVALDFRGRQNRVGEHDEFRLPTVSLWVDYAGARVDTVPDVDGGTDRGVLVVNSAVHESRNILRPSILPFFVGIVNRVEGRMKNRRDRPHAPPSKAEPSVPDAVPASVSGSALQAISGSPTARIRVRFTLRIDRSELRLSCAPDSNAYVDLKWESGGFLVSYNLGSNEISTVAGTVSGVTASLSHEFAEQGRSCIEAGAKDMAFSVALCPGTEDRPGKGLSVVLDTQMSAEFRLEAFSAWLIFTSVWIDNAPKLDLALRSAIPEATAVTVPLPPHEQRSKIAVAALVRFRSIDFDANASVSRAKLQVTPILLRTLSNGECTEVDLQIGVTEIVAKGDISGDLRSESLTFKTVRRSSRATLNTDPTVLSMSIHGGDLTGNLFLGDVNIVRFHLEPAQVTLADDWKAFTLDPNQQVFLAFAVQAGHFNGVLRLLAIPRLLGNFYTIFDTVESQQKIAAQRSEIFKSRQIQKSTEPSPMAAVILQTAKKAHGRSEGSGVRTAQTMRFDLGGIDIGVFNEDPEESGASDFYRFVVGKVEADLRRQVSNEGLPRRDLSLLVSSVRWDSSDGIRMAQQERKEMTARALIDLAPKYNRREVAMLPLMTLTMGSLEYSSPTTVEYDFDLIWGEADGDVSILPNFFIQASAAFRKLLRGLDEQQLARARRLGKDLPPQSLLSAGTRTVDDGETDDMSALQNNIIYRPRATTHPRALPIPRLKWLGEGTTDAARLIPRITAAVHELPVLSHRFVTLPLEDGMDLLLKLYEKQLPEGSAAITTAAATAPHVDGEAR